MRWLICTQVAARAWRPIEPCRWDEQDGLRARHFSTARHLQRRTELLPDPHRLFRKKQQLGSLELAVSAINTPPTS